MRVCCVGFPIAFLMLGSSALRAQNAVGAPGLSSRNLQDRAVTVEVIFPPEPGPGPEASLLVKKDGIPVTSERVDRNLPVQLLLVVDAVNSPVADLVRSEKAIADFLASGGGRLQQPTTILIVSDHRSTGVGGKTQDTAELTGRELYVHRIPASTDGNALRDEFERYRPGLNRILEAQAATGEAERVQLSLKALSFIATAEVAVAGPKVVLWIGPGWPMLAQGEGSNPRQLFDLAVYYSNLLRDARIILDAIDPAGVTAHEPNGQFYQSFLRSPRGRGDVDPNDLLLQVLAIQTGGLVVQFENRLQEAIARCAADAGHIATLRLPAPDVSGALHFHTLRVERRGQPTPLRTRAGFYSR